MPLSFGLPGASGAWSLETPSDQVIGPFSSTPQPPASWARDWGQEMELCKNSRASWVSEHIQVLESTPGEGKRK